MSKGYTAGDKLTLKIEKIVPRGYGLAFAEGLTVFVSLAAAGDVVNVRLREVKGKTAFAEIENIIEPSPDRITPSCQHFGSCGGCDFMQLNYPAQLKAKEAIIRDCLTRIAKINYDGPIEMIVGPQGFGYRLRAQWHADTRRRMIGYYRRNSRDLIDIAECPVLVPELQAELNRLRSDMPWETFFSEKAQIDAASGDACVSVYSPELMEPTDDVSFRNSGETYFFSARSFFQGNRFLVSELVNAALRDFAGDTALDLYSGVGLFTLPLARRFKNAIGVEENPEAVAFAVRNAEQAGLGNVEFVNAAVRDYLAESGPYSADLVLLDPPRAGTEKETMEAIIKMQPKVVSYVACEPSVLARDLKRFDSAGYKIESITAIDLFPQTHHVETVAILRQA